MTVTDRPEKAGAPTYDLLVIGGGINGVGIARDAAGRGLSVLLCERADLASATSSASSKLLHGGLRYLEQFQFGMVRHALHEREVLLAAAPHIVRPLRFVLPHNRAIRPYWMIRLGVFLYDRLAGRATLPDSTTLDFETEFGTSNLQSRFKRGFEYSDCWVDDSRLVILTALDACNRGAEIRTHTTCESAAWAGDHWDVRLREGPSGASDHIRARFVINAAGPWVETVARDVLALQPSYSARLVKGSHIVVPRLTPDPRAFILQNDDKRIVFVLPFEGDFSLIGTTDIPYEGDPAAAEIDEDEVEYLCEVVNSHFTTTLGAADVAWSYSGVRPLYDDGASSASRVSRDYVVEAHHAPDEKHVVAALSIWGGKLTGYRLLAEDVLSRLDDVFPEAGDPWTATAQLPGGKLFPTGLDAFTHMLTQVYDWLPADLAASYARRYGALTHTVLGNGSSLAALGLELSPGLYAREVDYLLRHEWARTVDDVLWRRTKLGLRAGEEHREQLAAYIEGRRLELGLPP